MAFPVPTNTTCDIYRNDNMTAGPLGVSGNLRPRARNIKSNVVYTHEMDLPLGTDVHTGDWLYVPNKASGTKFAVQVFQRMRFGGGNDYKRVYLNRQTPPWPTQNL